MRAHSVLDLGEVADERKHFLRLFLLVHFHIRAYFRPGQYVILNINCLHVARRALIDENWHTLLLVDRIRLTCHLTLLLGTGVIVTSNLFLANFNLLLIL